jgi:hypothetical protein
LRYRLVGVSLYYIPDRLELVKVGADEGGVDAVAVAATGAPSAGRSWWSSGWR